MNNPVTKVILAILVIALLAGSVSTVSAYTYNRQAAVDYARANALNDVPGSSYFKNNGGDCTNFISQCLKAGGWRQVSTNKNPALNWYYNKLSSRSPSWSGVQPFREFTIASGRGKETMFSPGTYTLPSVVPIQTGDIIQMDFTGDGKWDHTAIVTNLACSFYPPYDSLIWVSYHSDYKKDRALGDIIQLPGHQNIRFRVLLLKNTYSY